MYPKVTGYDIGALLYCPANTHGSIVNSLKNERIPHPFSLAFCLEDTIHESVVEQAEQTLHQTLTQIMQARKECEFYMPLIFIRIRSPKHLHKLAIQFQEFSEILTGFILPKFFVENCDAYIATIQDLKQHFSCNYYYMPIFESVSMIDLKSRYNNLAYIKEKLAVIADSILNIRVGGNDFSNAFGLRRHMQNTIYDLKPVANLLIDINTTFASQYVVSGPVWEYYAGDGWDTGLRNELELDLLSGFVGKTVIHPNQIPIVNEMLRVHKTDYNDAYCILNWDMSSGKLVSANHNAHRMNEYLTHLRWANKILRLAKVYGVHS